MNSARLSDRLSAAAGVVGVAGIVSALVALWVLGNAGCGKGSSSSSATEAAAKTPTPGVAGTSGTSGAPAAAARPPLLEPALPALSARKLALTPAASLPGALLLGEGAALVRLELAGGALLELPSPGAGVRLFPTEAVRGSLLVAIAVLDRELEGTGAEHAEQLALVDLGGAAPPRLVGPTGQVVRSPSFSADGKSLFFEASHQSFRDLYRLTLPAPTARGAAALGATTRLTDNREGNFAPALSPDGKTLAFASSRDGDSELYAMDLGASTRSAKSALPPVRRLTAFHRDDWNAVWSPAAASAELAFLSDREGIERLFIVRGDGTGLRRVTAEADAKASELAPAWSREGQLAYLRSLGGRAVLIAGAPGTASWRTLTPNGVGAGASFAWSPDGQWLAALELPPGEPGRAHRHGRLVVYAANGTARFEVTDLEGDATVRWVP
jgi:TolB protein